MRGGALERNRSFRYDAVGAYSGDRNVEIAEPRPHGLALPTDFEQAVHSSDSLPSESVAQTGTLPLHAPAWAITLAPKVSRSRRSRDQSLGARGRKSLREHRCPKRFQTSPHEGFILIRWR